jgi:ribosome-binding factor A
MYKRSDKVAEAIHEIVSGLLIKGIKDPRIGFVTITGVKVADDLHSAKVFFTVVGDETALKNSQAGLQSAAGFIRKEIGKNLRMRYVPELFFRFDESLERANTIERLLKQIHDEHPNDSSDT